MLNRPSLAPNARRELPICPDHPGSLVRLYRTHGSRGPGVYPQCVPSGGALPHLLDWNSARETRLDSVHSTLTPNELGVLEDAATGLTVHESARSRGKSSETVKSQRKAVLVKLGARNITQAVALATAQGIIDARAA
jgi:DNA-binding CsgD family transcriptional regulator